MHQIVTIREREFAEFVQCASEEELEAQTQHLESELNGRFENIRSPLSERMRDRLGVLNRALGNHD